MSPVAKASRVAPDADRRNSDAEGRNDVVLVGRVSAEPTLRVLPSGDELLSWRLVVSRDEPAKAARANAPTVDTIDCIAYKAVVRRLAARCVGGEVLEVHGALRRRFWRGANGLASRYEVEVFTAKRLSAATRRSETTA